MERLVDDGASAHSSTTFFDDTSSASEALSAASSDVDDGVAATRCVRPSEIEVHTGSRRPNPFPPWRLCLLPCFRFLTGALAVFVQGLMSL